MTSSPTKPVRWADRLLPMREAFEITGRSSSSYYRDIRVGRMPAPVSVGGSARIPGWELLDAINKLIAKRGAHGPEGGVRHG